MIVNAYKVNNNSTYVKIGGATTAATHVPVHLIAVIDISGSMEINNRLANVKRSLQHVVPLMTATDTFSLISFNEFSRIVCHNVVLNDEGKRQTEAYLDQLVADGSTNMGSALIAAQDLIARTPLTHTVCMLILTDGDANAGITETEDLVRLARSDRANTTIYSIGYGSTHNFELMRRLAQEANGSYSVVENLEHVATVFGDILGGILSIVAQNCEVLLPPGATAVTRLKTTEDASGTKVHVGNLYQGSEQALIVNGLPYDPSGSRSIRYRYFNVAMRALVTGTAVAAVESDAIIQADAEAYILRLDAASVTNNISNGTVTLAELDTMIRRLTEFQHVAWVPVIKAELERVAANMRAHPGMDPSHLVRATAANNYAVLSLGRGVSMSSQPMDYSQEAASAFSTPYQRMVSGTTSRAVSGYAATTSGLATSGYAASGAAPIPLPINVGGRGTGARSHLSPIQSVSEEFGSLAQHMSQVIPQLTIPEPPATFEEMVDPDRPTTPTAQIRRGRVVEQAAPRRYHALVQRMPTPEMLDDDLMQ